MKIAGVKRVTLIDYPDRVAATVFIAGCNLNCGFCHNRWMISERDVTEVMSPQSFLDWLATRLGKLDGVCITGGEPLMATDLPDLIAAIRGLGFLVKLDTNGFFPQRLSALLEARQLDYVAMDVKAPLDERYNLAAGIAVDLARLRASMTLVRRSDTPWEFRTTVHPMLDEQALLDIGRALEPQDTWILQPYIAADTVLESVRAQRFLTVAQLEEFLPRLRELVPGVSIRGD